LQGRITSYVGEGEFTKDKVESFGGYGVIKVPQFQSLLKHICHNGLEHHVAATRAQVADSIEDAFSTYLNWEVYHHR
jgi:L-fucose isomerase-like protein